MEYTKTHNPIHLTQTLGQRNLQSIRKYTQLINFESDDYHSAVATTIDEAKKLTEAGFEYVCTHENLMLFRKTKIEPFCEILNLFKTKAYAMVSTRKGVEHAIRNSRSHRG